jgi:NAD(P)-dependent dehydrogenase (short-subunit alcohol dehydrogenase family)
MNEQVIVVTGAFGALGSVLVRKAMQQGYAVAALGHAPAAPGELTTMLEKYGAVFPNVDLSDEAATLAAFDQIKLRFKAYFALINIAGGFRFETISQGSAATFDSLYSLNVRTTLNASKAAVHELIANKGTIVNIGAYAALQAKTGMGAYAASKSAVHRLTEALADELKETGVRVNAVLPSIIDTPVNRLNMPNADPSKWVTAAQVADVILFLASEAASSITGALIPVTGRL